MRRGFTLFELLLVLALMGVIALAAASALGRPGSRAVRAGEAVVNSLLSARVDAMRSGVPASTVVEAVEGGLRLHNESGDERSRERDVRLAGAGVWDETVTFGAGALEFEPGDGVRARFDASGRTDRRLWVLGSGDTMVEIRFDPLTGEARLHRDGG